MKVTGQFAQTHLFKPGAHPTDEQQGQKGHDHPSKHVLSLFS
jgi:hypothetical protein